jgi:hypothetical protein
MWRKIFLVVAAIALSYALTAFAGHVVYTHSKGRSDASLSVVVRFVINAMIVILVGAFVGHLSRNRPVPVAIIGLLPWAAVILSSPQKPSSLSGWAYWFSGIVIHLSLGAVAAFLVWRYGRRQSRQPGLLA